MDSLKQRIIYFAKLTPRERPNDLIDRLYKIIGELLDSSVLLAQRQEQGIEVLFKQLEQASR